MATRKKLKKIKLNETVTLLTNKESQDISKIETLEQSLENKLDKNNSNLLSDEEKQKITNLDNTINGINKSIRDINNKVETKVDKDGNKVLSDNNFTSDYKDKLDNLDNLEQSLNSKVDKVNISDDLVTEDKTKVLSAKQGKELKRLLDSLNQSITNSGGTVIENSLNSDSETNGLSAKQGKELKHAIDNLQTLLTSDDTTLDSIQEIVNYIKQNRETLSQLSIDNLAGLEEKVNQLIVNSLDSDDNNKALSAAQGKALKELVDSKVNVIVEDTLNSSSTVNALSAAQGQNLKNLIDSKVDKDGNKVLSEEDFTSYHKQIVESTPDDISSINELANNSILKPRLITINNSPDEQNKTGVISNYHFSNNEDAQYNSQNIRTGDEFILKFNKGNSASHITLKVTDEHGFIDWNPYSIKLNNVDVLGDKLRLPDNQVGYVRVWFDGLSFQLYGPTNNNEYQIISESEALDPNNNLARLISGQILGLLLNSPYRKLEDIRHLEGLPNDPKFKNHHSHFGFILGRVLGLPGLWYNLITLNTFGSGSPNDNPLMQLAFGEGSMYIRQEITNNAWSQWKKVILGNKGGGFINLEQRGDVGINFKNTGTNNQLSMWFDNQGKFFLGNPQTSINIFWANNDYYEFSAYPTVHPSKSQSNLGHSLVRKDYVDNLAKSLLTLLSFDLKTFDIKAMLTNSAQRKKFNKILLTITQSEVKALYKRVKALSGWGKNINFNDNVSYNNGLTANNRVGIIFHSTGYWSNSNDGVIFNFGLADGQNFTRTITGGERQVQSVTEDNVNFVTLNGATMSDHGDGLIVSEGFYLS